MNTFQQWFASDVVGRGFRWNLRILERHERPEIRADRDLDFSLREKRVV
jgi:hypothetical protein